MGKFTIPEWRRAKNISQAKMASALGIHVNTYRKMESQPSDIRLHKLVEICKILGVKVSDINFSGEETENRDGEE